MPSQQACLMPPGAIQTMEEEILEQSNGLDERAVKAGQSKDEAGTLIEEFIPFLNGRVAKYTARLDIHLREDVFSAAMSAFYEAVQNYDIEKGHFFPFANRVVCARIIDHIRKISRHEGKTISLNGDDQQSTAPTVVDLASIRNYQEERRRESLADEIEQFKTEIAAWGITLDALVQCSPKHKELRKKYKEIVSSVAEHPDIMQTISLKRYFPVCAVSKITGMPVKKIERARVYILAAIIIKTGDYELMSEYI